MRPEHRPRPASLPERTLAVALALLVAALGLWVLSLSGQIGRAAAGHGPSLEEVIPSGVVPPGVATSPPPDGAQAGLYDSHPDADVGRILQADLVERAADGVRVSTNRFGMRERDYALPKPTGRLRVVILGDSYVFGMSVEAEQRLGAQLETMLRERAARPDEVDVEVLHLAVISWNLVNEVAYMRRQLDLLQPDLVVHVTVSNDLADSSGIRGFGAMARMAPRSPRQAQCLVTNHFAKGALHSGARGHLPRGMDWESQRRFSEGEDALAQLAREVERQGGRYLHVFNWLQFSPAAARLLAPGLRKDQTAWLPISVFEDERYRISSQNGHWNPAGHEQMAVALFGWIVQRDLLPALPLRPWARAGTWVDTLSRRAAPDRRAAQRFGHWIGNVPVAQAIDFGALTAESASQVHTGVYGGGGVGPYASMMLARGHGTTLHVVGSCLQRPELDGAQVVIFVDDVRVGELRLQAGAAIDFRCKLPVSVEGRGHLSVRFQAHDWVYMGASLRECIAFELQRVAIE